jgi:hypothetical protein
VHERTRTEDLYQMDASLNHRDRCACIRAINLNAASLGSRSPARFRAARPFSLPTMLRFGSFRSKINPVSIGTDGEQPLHHRGGRVRIINKRPYIPPSVHAESQLQGNTRCGGQSQTRVDEEFEARATNNRFLKEVVLGESRNCTCASHQNHDGERDIVKRPAASRHRPSGDRHRYEGCYFKSAPGFCEGLSVVTNLRLLACIGLDTQKEKAR